LTACSQQPRYSLRSDRHVRPPPNAWAAFYLAALRCSARCVFLNCFRCRSGTSIFQCWAGLPLLAIASTQPQSAVASQNRFAWIFAIIAAAVCTILVYVAQFKLWTSVCALAAGLAIVVHGTMRKKLLLASAGLLMLLTLLAFASKSQIGSLLPGDILHIGLALTLVLLSVRENEVSLAQ
jgi:hypothetical protein